ncbi:MAG TPA: ferrochelatase [Intrasporangiaceae bacterium]|nr:ferrochelatase [Intrasporangiaceae bacterium]
MARVEWDPSRQHPDDPDRDAGSAATPRRPGPLRVGVVLANTGTPERPDPDSVRNFLAEFLADPRIVDYPRWFWLPLLKQVILRRRPAESAQKYQRIWTEHGSPLRYLGDRLADRVERRLNDGAPGDNQDSGADRVRVVAAMRYGRPSIAAALTDLVAAGADRLIVLPLFPQTSGTTVDSIADAVATWQADTDPGAPLRFVRGYSREERYLDAVTESVQTHWSQHGRPDHLVISFHGIPRRYGSKGDTYEEQCRHTAQEVASRLGLSPQTWSISYQSKFGPEPWLGPSTLDTLTRLAEQRPDQVHVVCPGFAIDCLETVDEIGFEAAQHYRAAGGRGFDYVPALNDSEDAVELVARLIQQAL